MRRALSVQLAVDPPNICVDPGFRSAVSWFRTGGNYLVKGGVYPHLEPVASDGAGKAPAHMKFVERNDPTLIGAHPKDAAGRAALRHWEKSGPVSPKQQFRREGGLAHE
jgi:hypothetical protein